MQVSSVKIWPEYHKSPSRYKTIVNLCMSPNLSRFNAYAGISTFAPGQKLNESVTSTGRSGAPILAEAYGVLPLKPEIFWRSHITSFIYLRALARRSLCYWAHRKLGMTAIEIGKKLNLCQSAISRYSIKGHAIAQKDGLELMAEKKA